MAGEPGKPGRPVSFLCKIIYGYQNIFLTT
jgi:hypothetical protein